jgi:hypothetical protein
MTAEPTTKNPWNETGPANGTSNRLQPPIRSELSGANNVRAQYKETTTNVSMILVMLATV